jgi:hypothetical protein
MAGESERRVDIALCEKHGLRYNAADGGGCVRCRREAGLPPAGAVRSTAAPGPARPAAPPRTDPPASALVQGLIALALVAATGVVFWSAHGQVLAGFGAMVTGGASEDVAGESDGDLGYGLEDDGSGFDGTEPAAYPPGDTVAIGPAEQQRQMDEVMRQMQEDAEADAADFEAQAAGDDYGYDEGDGQ